MFQGTFSNFVEHKLYTSFIKANESKPTMNEKQNVLIDDTALNLFNLRVDELCDKNSFAEMESFINHFETFTPVFVDDFREAEFHYMLGNAHSLLFRPQLTEWFDPTINKAIIHYKKALIALKVRDIDDIDYRELAGRTETNLGRYLEKQGRFMCAMKHYKAGISLNNEPIAHCSLFNLEMYLAQHVCYDIGKRPLHYYLAYKNVCNRLKLSNDTAAYNDAQYLFDETNMPQDFMQWFENEIGAEEFEKEHKFERNLSRKEQQYLLWCRDNNLFLNELEIDSLPYFEYPDLLELPSIQTMINFTCAYHENLIYHTNFEEIKSEYCYARHLIYQASNIKNETKSFYNSTFRKTEDLLYSVDNIKAQNYKTAFRTLYSLFDKIAYFINHFYDLNNIAKDKRINFENLFTKLGSKNWQPHPKLKETPNEYLHALFYILKDLRDIYDHDSVADLLNPDIKRIYEIRNYIEHRSIKIIDDEYAFLVNAQSVQETDNRILDELQEENEQKLSEVHKKLKEFKGTEQTKVFEEEKAEIEKVLGNIKALHYEKQKRSQHSLIITDKEFETQLMTLIELVRNSIIYLAFSIEYENQLREDEADETIHIEVPTKD